MECIGTNYEMLGTLLLNDDTGVITTAIIEEYQKNAFKINHKVLQKWIQGQGRQPVTWVTLIEVLRSVNLSQLAGTVEDSLS